LFSKRPHGIFDPKETFTIVKTPLPTQSDLKDGQFLVKIFYLSLDPAMRGWMNNIRSYIRPVEINDVMRGQNVGEVVLSKNPKFKVGDKVLGTLGWQEYALTDGKDVQKITSLPGASLRDYLGIFGTTGMTAYFGLLDSK
jgi:NADPH-dependent curcumin reductase CurA